MVLGWGVPGERKRIIIIHDALEKELNIGLENRLKVDTQYLSLVGNVNFDFGHGSLG